MKINLSNAIKKFYPNPVLEQVYFEAIANSIYANANKIELNIYIEDYSKPKTFKVNIKDNGDGFTDENFRKYCKLLETDDEERKGLGRLVFLNYFKKVDISSTFQNKKRTFKYSKIFDEKFKITEINSEKNETILNFSGYLKNRIYKYDFLKPVYIKKAVELHFFPLFHQYKKEKKDLEIIITLEKNNENKLYNDTKKIIVKEIPDLKFVRFKADNFFDKIELFYSIKKTYSETSIITAICAEGRTIPLNILSKENMPEGYEIIFLFYSDYFNGKVNSSRQKLDIDNYTRSTIDALLISQINNIFKQEIPSIQKSYKKIQENLINKYPHYYGLFDENSVGLINKNKSLEIAREKFFQTQKKILEAQNLSDEQYKQAIEISSRLLTEYILYRNIIIGKLKKMNPKNKEEEIHNIIVPKGEKFKSSNFINDIYTNNAWLLDDKFMTYSTILSEKRMIDLIKEITKDDKNIEKNMEGKPDISIIFSDYPENVEKVDVVIIELKRLGLKLAGKEELISQLKQRARRLLKYKYCKNKIQRIWFYGIIDFSQEFIDSLEESDYFEIYSKDKVFYGEEKVKYNGKFTFIGVNLLSFDAFWQDAESRNSTFLKILKDGFKK